MLTPGVVSCIPHNVKCSMHTTPLTPQLLVPEVVWCTHSTLHTTLCTPHTTHCKPHTSHSTQHTAHCTPHSAHKTLFTAHRLLHSMMLVHKTFIFRSPANVRAFVRNTNIVLINGTFFILNYILCKKKFRDPLFERFRGFLL